MPGRRRVNLAWKRMKEPLHLVGNIDKRIGIRNVPWPFDHWINYVFTQPSEATERIRKKNTPRSGASGAEWSTARAPGLDRPGENPVLRTGASKAKERI